MTDIQIPTAFKELFTPKRYKVYYGGRGGGKSVAVALALLVIGMQKPTRVLCTRELQASIADSVHRLLSDLIRKYGLDGQYEILQTTIRGKNGTEFLFKGLKHNITEIKGLEGIDIVWVEEAENISERSWELLIPTIRKEGSEIWIVLNPRNATDPTYQRFIASSHDDVLLRKVSWRDNPFFPDVLRKEMQKLKEQDGEAYQHIWEGELDTRRSGSVYAKQLSKARDEGRICRVPYDPTSEVFTAWDLGWGDSTAIWFAQFIGRELRVIDYYENNNESLEHYTKIIKEKPYNYMRNGHYLPHDAAAGNIRGDSVDIQLRRLGVQNQVLENSSIEGGIESARQLMQICVFDVDKCRDGLWALENYSYEWDDDAKVFKKRPRHDFSSHGADAFRYLSHAVTKIKGSTQSQTKVSFTPNYRYGGSFMGA